MGGVRGDTGAEEQVLAIASIVAAFDPLRQAILLLAGDTSGMDGARFFDWLISTADERYARHLERIDEGSRKER